MKSLPLTLNQDAWFRIHRSEHSPLFFGKRGLNRFDARGGEFGVMYLGDSARCCFVETYGRSAPGYHRIVTRRELETRSVATVEFTGPLSVVDLTGAGLARIGADNRLATGEYEIAQRWSHALWSHPEQPDGLWYRSRHDPSQTCVALFDRVAEDTSASDGESLIASANTELLAEILDDYDIGFLE